MTVILDREFLYKEYVENKKTMREISNETTVSLDRIDSNIGYIEGNVQWIHKALNNTKNTMPNDEFINWCKLVAENNK